MHGTHQKGSVGLGWGNINSHINKTAPRNPTGDLYIDIYVIQEQKAGMDRDIGCRYRVSCHPFYAEASTDCRLFRVVKYSANKVVYANHRRMAQLYGYHRVRPVLNRIVFTNTIHIGKILYKIQHGVFDRPAHINNHPFYIFWLELRPGHTLNSYRTDLSVVVSIKNKIGENHYPFYDHYCNNSFILSEDHRYL
jgi:hypothetical protein